MAYKNKEDARKYKQKHYLQNKTEVLSYSRAYYLKNRERILARCRGAHLKRTYDLTEDQWNFLFFAQQDRCGLCGAVVTGSRGWHTDHCHDTDQLRAILCHGCNTGLGKFKHNPQLLRDAALYIEIHEHK